MKPCPVCESGFLIEGKCCDCGYVYNQANDNPIKQFCIDIIEGSGGLDDYEYYEMATATTRREIAVSIHVIKCLANPHNPLSEEILRLIEERRKELADQ